MIRLVRKYVCVTVDAAIAYPELQVIGTMVTNSACTRCWKNCTASRKWRMRDLKNGDIGYRRMDSK